MGEFGSAVSALLDAFSSGIAVIKQLRRRREAGWLITDSGLKKEEVCFARSLKRNRADVETAYTRDLAKFGSRFAEGDTKAQSSLASILLRLNAGFVNIIDRFTRGESTRSDYEMLVNLSNSSRDGAIDTFGQLSSRLSQSAGALLVRERNQVKASRKLTGPKTSRGSTAGPVAHPRPKRAPELSVAKTILGPATSQGWVRPREKRSSSSTSTKIHLRSRVPAKSRPSPNAGSQNSKVKTALTALASQASSSPRLVSLLPSVPDSMPARRISLISCASGSTKLGEIPDWEWADGRKTSLKDTAFPLAPLGDKPKKPRSRFMRLFRK